MQRPSISSDGKWSFFGGDLQTWVVSNSASSFTSGQLFKAKSPHTGIGPKSTATPPYHTHIFQTETFHVKSGILAYKIDGKTGKLTKGEKKSIGPGIAHTFWNSVEEGQDLEVEITVTGGDNPGFDETFIHNFYGYLSSVTMAGSSPNPFQMLRFLDSADVILADPPFGLGRALNVLIGRWIGGYLLGFQTRYKIFDD